MASRTVAFLGFTTTLQRLVVIAVTLVVIALLYYLIRRTRLGKAMRATAQDREIAELMGVEIGRIAQLTFIIGGALAALGGGLIAPIFLVQPDMGLLVSQKAFVVVILGGMGNVVGAVSAAFFLGVVESLGAGFISSEFRDLIAFGMLILVLWLRPEGFLGRTAKKGG
jgi:branched-chain amino acid transport system permease protein